MEVLSEKGFQRPLYEEILAALVARAKLLFGNDMETDEKTPFGKNIRLYAAELDQAYELVERVYYSIFANTATGSALRRLSVEAGLNGGNPATRAVHRLKVTGTKGYILPAGFLVSTQSGGVGSEPPEFHTEQEYTLDEAGEATILVSANLAGESGNVQIGAISRIVKPDANLTAIRHIALEEAGKDAETDPELRARYHQAKSGGGAATRAAIRAAVLRVTGVRSCTVIENDTQEVDAAGRPPGSFECIVFAPADLDVQIASAIFSKKPAGIKAVGTVQVEVKDESGEGQIIAFSHVADKQIYARVTVAVDERFPQNGKEQIKMGLAEQIAGLSNGGDVVLSRMYGPVLSVRGVCDIEVLEVSEDGTQFHAGNIPCSPMEAAVLPMGNVTVEVKAYGDR